MKKLMYIILAGLLLVAISYVNLKAEESIVSSNIKHIYEDITISEPYTKEECYFKEVPVYTDLPSNQVQGSEVVTSMLLGGLLGKVVTGNDKGAVGGAMLGGVLSAAPRPSQRILHGHMKEEVCQTVIKSKWVTKNEYSHSLITFKTSDGYTYELQFQR